MASRCCPGNDAARTKIPYDQFASPYVGMGNDPVNNVDPSGGGIEDGVKVIGSSLGSVAASGVGDYNIAIQFGRGLSEFGPLIHFSASLASIARNIEPINGGRTCDNCGEQGKLADRMRQQDQLNMDPADRARDYIAKNRTYSDASIGSEPQRNEYQQFVHDQKMAEYRDMNGLNEDGTAKPLTKLMNDPGYQRFANNIGMPIVNVMSFYGGFGEISEIGALTRTSRIWEVGAYQDLRGVELGLDAHHAGQKAIFKNLIAGYDEATAPSILVPKMGHTIRGPFGIVDRSTLNSATGLPFTNARQVLARDIFELRRVYGTQGIPNSSLGELIEMNKTMYPGSFIKVK